MLSSGNGLVWSRSSLLVQDGVFVAIEELVLERKIKASSSNPVPHSAGLFGSKS